MKRVLVTAGANTIGLVKTVATGLGPRGMRAHAICPGSVNGPRIDCVIVAEVAAADDASGAVMKRLTDPEDVAGMALLLAPDAAKMVAGQAIVVDGMTYNVDP